MHLDIQFRFKIERKLMLILICSTLLSFTQSFHVPIDDNMEEEDPKLQSYQILGIHRQKNSTKHVREAKAAKNEGGHSYYLAYGEEYLDQILSALRTQLVKSGFARLSLPDLTESFSRKILGMTFYGSASLKNGSLEGIETIRRTEPSTISPEMNGDVIIESKIGVDDASVAYDAHAEFMGLGPSAQVTGKLSSIEAILIVKLNIFALSAELSEFDVVNTGDLSVQVKGLGTVLDFLGKHIAQLVGNSLKHVVLKVLEDEIKNQINDIIINLRFLPSPMQAISTAAEEYIMKAFQNLSSLLNGK